VNGRQGFDSGGVPVHREKNRYAGTEILRLLEEARNYNAHIVRLIERNLEGARRLLDFGAGAGTFAKLLRARGYEIICVEPDLSLAASLKRDGFEAHPDFSAFENGSLDSAFSLNVLEHIADDGRALGELAARIAKGGRIFLYVPAFPWLWTSLDDKVGHKRRYTKRALTELAWSQGLEVTATGYADCLGVGAAVLFKLFGNDEGRLSSAGVRAYDRFLTPLSTVLDRVFHSIAGKNVWLVCRKR